MATECWRRCCGALGITCTVGVPGYGEAGLSVLATAVDSSHTIHLDFNNWPLIPVPVLLMGVVKVPDEHSKWSSSSLGKPPKVEGAGSMGMPLYVRPADGITSKEIPVSGAMLSSWVNLGTLVLLGWKLALSPLAAWSNGVAGLGVPTGGPKFGLLGVRLPLATFRLIDRLSQQNDGLPWVAGLSIQGAPAGMLASWTYSSLDVYTVSASLSNRVSCGLCGLCAPFWY